jgi:general secretion pathway protein H
MRARGFTLIELLVVVVILGVLAAALVLSTAGSGERRLEREAERLRTLVAYACEQAELRGREIGVSLNRTGYRFSEFDRDSWVGFREGELRPRDWLTGTAALLSRDGRMVEVADAYPDKPQLLCFSSGELTPFRLELGLGEIAVRYRLDGTPDGAVAVTTVRDRVR